MPAGSQMSGKPSAQDESAFMEDLLLGIDNSFFDHALSPDPTPKKRRRTLHEQPDHVLTENTRNADVVTTPVKKKTRTLDVALDAEIAVLFEGSENWDWDDMLTPVRNQPITNVSLAPPEDTIPVLRCAVDSVEHSGSAKRLYVTTNSEPNRKAIVLQDDWAETEVQSGDIVNIIGTFSPKDNTIVVSSKSNLLIHHPDILVTATSVANALHCRRKSLLSSLVHSSSEKTHALVWGNMLHEIMQHCLSTHRWDASSIDAFIDQNIQRNLMDLININVGVDEAKKEIRRRAGGLKAFGERFLGEIPKPNAVMSDTRSGHDKVARLAISRLLDVEEEIWAPKFGLKGKIDASLQVRIDEYIEPTKAGYRREAWSPSTITARMPLEIKTGRAIAGMEHRAQTILYSVLMAERHGQTLPNSMSNSLSSSAAGGLLFYTQTEDIIRVPTVWNELRGLIIARNELASYLMRRSKLWKESSSCNKESENNDGTTSLLPPTIDEERACSRCFVADACMLYRKAVENVHDDDSPIADIYELKTGHLSLEQTQFFKHWENLITLEEQDMTRFRKEMWTLGADEREKSGKCLANMVLDVSFSGRSATIDGRIRRYTYRFIRNKRQGQDSSNSRSLLHGHITPGEPVVISVSEDPQFFALARGFVLELSPQEIVVGVDHTLSLDYIRSESVRYGPRDDILFRIDRDELMGGMGRVRDNLAQLFYINGPRNLLQCVVDLRPPVFDTELDRSIDCGSSTLNEDQLYAVQHILRARDYAIILGMPGTGKTTTVAHLIKILVDTGKTVLLTSYTHSAVDTILLKLKEIVRFEILRLGNKDKVHPDIQKFTLDTQDPSNTVAQLENMLLCPPVVAATALSTDHALFSRRRFDYCIVDEASQITLPTCIGPLRFADKFVLVGDHFQLPPLVKNKAARKGGLDVSLFRRLSDAHPHAVVDLTRQYRMNADIMLLANKLIYSNRLKCGSSEVANRSLIIPNKKDKDCCCGCEVSTCWISRILDESCKAIFVDTDGVPALDSRIGDLIQNEKEASLVQQLTLALLKGGVREEQIGILSLYRQQIKLLSNLLEGNKGIEVLTADRSQGRDKDCIIISLVRANKDNQIGDLLKDWRRINVAFTRARAKLVIFGSKKTLKTSSLLSDFFGFMEERGWVLTLAEGADVMHTKGNKTNRAEALEYSKPLATTRERCNQPKKAKQGSVATSLLRSRPILKDIVNDSK